MKQVIQNLKSGETSLIDVPCPRFRVGSNLIQTSCSLISAGTERMLVEFGKGGVLSKARQQPDKVRMVIDKMRTNGIFTTIDAVQSKLDRPLAIGYCNTGRILETEPSSVFEVGDRVISNGHHAEIVSVPHHLCAKVPDSVTDEDAAFTVIGAIGLQGIRLASPTLGESFTVTGLGLVGLMTVQMLVAQGCRVLGVDFDSKKCALARSFGAEVVDLSRGEDPVSAARCFSRGRGMDGVLICAMSTSNKPIHQAATMCRKRGRIILVGVVGLELARADFFEKELTFQVSCSYGPGRYDPRYEEKGHDYPISYVRWTEQRNFEAVLDLMAAGKLDVAPLINYRFPLKRAEHAYSVLMKERTVLGVLLNYPEKNVSKLTEQTIRLNSFSLKSPIPSGSSVVGFLGAGNYASRVLIPAFNAAGAVLHSIASIGGVSGHHFGTKFGFIEATTDTGGVIENDAVNTVVIATRHNSHADFTCSALEAGKHVFVEKPLCLTLDELKRIESFLSVSGEQISAKPVLMIGFNRRFSPLVIEMRELLASVIGPKSIVISVNAGHIPAEHWTQDMDVGGGRLVGEACHFIDLLRFIAGKSIVASSVMRMGADAGDTVTIQLGFADGSIGTVHYFANGHHRVPKERVEVFCQGKVLQLDNFRVLKGYGFTGFKRRRLLRQDKGAKNCVVAFLESITKGTVPPIPYEEIIEVSRISIEIANRQNSAVQVTDGQGVN